MKYIKYPRTPHLPWSRGISSDDTVLVETDVAFFSGKRVIISEKMDGECTTLYRNKVHARSLDSANHPSRNWVKNFWGMIRHNIPEDIRICGENCFAKHSIHYTNLPSYFLGFNAWRENVCLAWDETIDLFNKIGIIPVKVLYDGIFSMDAIKSIKINENLVEGYVVRVSSEFFIDDFAKNVGKYVRDKHVQTDVHWMHQAVTPNILKEITL